MKPDQIISLGRTLLLTAPNPPNAMANHGLILGSFGDRLNVAVIGASGGLGRAFAEDLDRCEAVAALHSFSRSDSGRRSNKHSWQRLDLEDESSIADAAALAKRESGMLHLVIVATGILHDGAQLQPEKSWRSIGGPAMETAFRVNTIGPALVAKHFLPLLASDRKSVFAALSARVGSIEDNELGGWYVYRASKAALNMVIKTLSIELARRNSLAICVGLHPGTVDSALSKPFQGGVPKGKLFQPASAARALLTVLDGLSPDDSGGLFAWDGTRIPF